MSFRMLDPGFLTTVQDLGRFGFQKYGVGVGGAADWVALRAANRLVGNDGHEAALEITMTGPQLVALGRCLVAVTGAQHTLRVRERSLPMNTALLLREGETLEFAKWETGTRAYLAIAGGIDVPLVLNSRSTDLRGAFGGFKGRALRTGDVISGGIAEDRMARAGTALPDSLTQYYNNRSLLRVICGPHGEYFPDDSLQRFLGVEFSVSELSDRMAVRLHGDPIRHEGKGLLSCGMTLGAIQVSPDGHPIVLLADHQTTGGYPVIGTVIRADIPLLAQLKGGDRVSFQQVTIEQAYSAKQEVEEMLDSIQ